MSNKWMPANRFLGARKRYALENGVSDEWVEADLIIALRAGDLAARGQQVLLRRIQDDDDLLPGSGLERDLSPVADIPSVFWDGLIFHGGRVDWESCHFEFTEPISSKWQAFTAVQISQPQSPLPPDSEILAKALAMLGEGLTRDMAAKSLRLEPGFEAVTNEHVRRLLKGAYPRGRPRKKSN